MPQAMEIDEQDVFTQQGAVPVRSVEGWIVVATKIHEEASEEEVTDLFEEYGRVRQFTMNLDKRTGYVKGYALIEYQSLSEATEAVKQLNGSTLYDQVMHVDFAFVRPDDELKIKRSELKIRDRALESDRGRGRSRSPARARSRSRSRSASLDYSRQH